MDSLASAILWGLIIFCSLGGLALLLKEIFLEIKDKKRMASKDIILEQPIKRFYQGYTK